MPRLAIPAGAGDSRGTCSAWHPPPASARALRTAITSVRSLGSRARRLCAASPGSKAAHRRPKRQVTDGVRGWGSLALLASVERAGTGWGALLTGQPLKSRLWVSYSDSASERVSSLGFFGVVCAIIRPLQNSSKFAQLARRLGRQRGPVSKEAVSWAMGRVGGGVLGGKELGQDDRFLVPSLTRWQEELRLQEHRGKQTQTLGF